MQYVLTGTDGAAGLRLEDSPRQLSPGPREVVLRLAAVALNYRDIMIARGRYPLAVKPELVPVSDGAGTIVAVGRQVRGLAPGDRVMTNFFVDWAVGGIRRALVQAVLGSTVDGVLAREVVLPVGAILPIPGTLSFADAATLPCAGVTAWNALFHTASLEKGNTVLLQGTGGVSSLALQFATARGIRVIQTSSSDKKLAAARAGGADALINYRDTPDWDEEVRRLTGGEGVDAVVEVAGASTLERSVRATRMGGTVAAIGLVSGLGTIDPLPILTGVVRVAGVFVGSHAMAREMLDQIAVSGLRSAIDRSFPFEEAPAAFDYLESGPDGPGKVVVDCGD